MTFIFWICWMGEMIGSIWWISSEMKWKMLAPNPLSFLSGIYLLMVLAIRYGFDAPRLTALMVMIPAVPLALCLLLILLYSLLK